MRKAVVAVVLLSILAVASASGGGEDDAELDKKDENVPKLTKDTFDEFIRGDLSLVEFYAPWCGHCKRLRPEYAEAQRELIKHDPPIPLAKVDATTEGELAGRYKVNGYPTLKIFRNGKDYEYNGGREKQTIIDYMLKQVGPAAKPLTTAEEVEKFVTVDNDRDYVVVGFFKDKSSQLYSSLMVVANKLRDDYSFGVVTNAELGKPYGVEGDAALIAFKNFDDKKTVYSASSKTKDVEAFVKQQAIPLVGEFKKSKESVYQKRELPIAKYYMKVDWSAANTKHTKFYTSRLEQVAKEFQNQIIVAVVNAADYTRDLEALGWKDKQNDRNWEGGLVIEKSPKEKYRFDKAFKVPALKKFFTDFLNRDLKVYVRSEEPPTSNDGPVTVVVGSTFNDIVLDDSKDVMIEFYAPWCGHCKALEPKYKKVGQKFKDQSDQVVIAKIDATANDVPPEFEVSGFPTIYFKPAGKKSKPMKYEGERETDDIVKFIKTNAKALKKSKK